MSNQSEVVPPFTPVSPLDAFQGTIVPAKTGPLYKAGLAVVAFAMVLLPVIYIGLIAATAWLVFLHLAHDTWIFDGASGRGAVFRLILYLGPAVAGAILVFFMVKPFFASRAKPPDPISLDPAKEPLLFAFVEKVCRLVGAPVPCRIDVDCQVNASASLRSGFASRDLVLTIGLPLASGLDMRQFAGVLAHEFGHFAQGAGMRLTYIIRRINSWFAHVVYERDAWDVKLEESAKGADWRIGIVLHAARGCVWLTRRVLWGLMQAGHAISCFMLRQMEYDADSYEAKLAGSDTFASTAARLRVLSVATQTAYDDVRQSWASNRLPENLPLLIGHKAASLPEEVHQKLAAAATTEETGWFDTHPCDADRTRAVERLNEPGVFRLTDPATGLFTDFAAVSRSVTRYQYEKHFELEITDQNLMSSEEVLRESAASAEADAMIRKFFGKVNISLLPLLLEGDLTPPADSASAPAQWREARATTESLRPEAETISAEWVEQQGRLVDFAAAHQLAHANFQLEPKEFGLPETATSAAEQEAAALTARNETSAAISEQVHKLEPFVSALRQRATLALRLGRVNGNTASPEGSMEVADLVRALVAVGSELEHVHKMVPELRAFTLLAQNRDSHSNPLQVDAVVSEVTTRLQALTIGLQRRLTPVPYPFLHARGKLTVAEYARSEQTADNDWHRVYLNSSAHIERLFGLNYRLIGRVLSHVDAAERSLEAEAPEART